MNGRAPQPIAAANFITTKQILVWAEV